MTKLIGRKILCNLCKYKTVRGTTQVYRRLIFSFCPRCWMNRRAAASKLMEGVGQ